MGERSSIVLSRVPPAAGAITCIVSLVGGDAIAARLVTIALGGFRARVRFVRRDLRRVDSRPASRGRS